MDKIEHFPLWDPQANTIRKFNSSDFKIRYMALRNSSSAFIKRADVRKYVFKKYNYKCYLCGSYERLQIDHIISVYKFAKESIHFAALNTEENLAAICSICNAAKSP